MANLSQQKRLRMLEFLQTIREEHKNDDDVLAALGEIESELNAKKYGLVWEQHEEAVDMQMRDNIPVFTECIDKEITADTGGNYNFLLEGDNLHSLRLLEKTHCGKIDLIYIDPPYNTKNKDFVYDDIKIDSTDGYQHSKWLSFMSEPGGKQTIVMKAPTGSGKTIILIDYVDKYLTNIISGTAFIWLCPGKGNLEEQSRDKMRRSAPGRATQNLFDAMQNGFAPGSTTFINWELVTKKGNTAIRDSERKNLFDRIAEAHRGGMQFIVIIDEEHSNNTAKARTVIDSFAAKNIIRVSATASENKRYEFFEINRQSAGKHTSLITSYSIQTPA